MNSNKLDNFSLKLGSLISGKYKLSLLIILGEEIGLLIIGLLILGEIGLLLILGEDFFLGVLRSLIHLSFNSL